MMQWSCPHCRTQLTTSEDHLGSGWSFSRCAHCNGYSLIRKTEINVIRVDKAPPGEKIIPSHPYFSKPEEIESPSISPSPSPATSTLALGSTPLTSSPLTPSPLTPDPTPHPSELAKRLNEKTQSKLSPPPFTPSNSIPSLSNTQAVHPTTQMSPTLKENIHSLNPSLPESSAARTLEAPPRLESQKTQHTTPPHSPSAALSSSIHPRPQDLILKNPALEETRALSQITLNISGTQFPNRDSRSQTQPTHPLFSHPPSSSSRSYTHTVLAIIGILTGGFVVMNQRNIILHDAHLEEVMTDEVKQTALAPVASSEQHKKWIETQKELLNAHEGPGSHFPVITQLAPYTLYEVQDIQNSWIKVGLDHLPPELHTKSAWVPAQQVHFKNE